MNRVDFATMAAKMLLLASFGINGHTDVVFAVDIVGDFVYVVFHVFDALSVVTT